MRPGFTAIGYRNVLHSTYEQVHATSTNAAWKGRLLAVPLGLAITLTIPLVKLLSFLEAILFAIANLLTPLLPKYCSFYDAWVSLKYSSFFFVGFLASPFTAIFAGSAVITSMLVNPVKASRKFADTCKE